MTRDELRNEDESGGRPVVLVVEDDVDILAFIAMELMEEYRVLQAVDGRDGLEQAIAEVPDVVITDLMMPVMNGLELCERLKNDMATSHIPVIMLTARSSLENELEGLKKGADDYVVKPFNMQVLRARLENLIKARRALWKRYAREFGTAEVWSEVRGEKDVEFIERLEEVLARRFSDWEFRAEDFAAELGMSLRTLQRKLKAVTGESTGGCIAEYRMKRAAELLSVTARNVTEIAFEVGYDESSSFSRVFKKRFNMSPSEYRASRLGG